MGEDDGAPTEQLIWNQQEVWSGRGDLNARPPAPKARKTRACSFVFNSLIGYEATGRGQKRRVLTLI